jgi:hypothetical protein
MDAPFQTEKQNTVSQMGKSAVSETEKIQGRSICW